MHRLATVARSSVPCARRTTCVGAAGAARRYAKHTSITPGWAAIIKSVASHDKPEASIPHPYLPPRAPAYEIRPDGTIHPPPPPPPPPEEPLAPQLRERVVRSLKARPRSMLDLPGLAAEYERREGQVLRQTLRYESRPERERRVKCGGVFEDTERDDGAGSGMGVKGASPSSARRGRGREEEQREEGVVMVVHAAQKGEVVESAACSGFVIGKGGSKLIVTCTHTFHQVKDSDLLHPDPFPRTTPTDPGSSGTLVSIDDIVADAAGVRREFLYPAVGLASALHASDLLILSTPNLPAVRSLPVSPYPAPIGSRVAVHCATHVPPPRWVAGRDGWRWWTGGAWARWAPGEIIEYRNSRGGRSEPGTYDELAQMLFKPAPPQGSSGGPIVDANGAVVGVVLGTTQLSNGETVGWGAPAESIFEMFSLPGLQLQGTEAGKAGAEEEEEA